MKDVYKKLGIIALLVVALACILCIAFFIVERNPRDTVSENTLSDTASIGEGEGLVQGSATEEIKQNESQTESINIADGFVVYVPVGMSVKTSVAHPGSQKDGGNAPLYSVYDLDAELAHSISWSEDASFGITKTGGDYEGTKLPRVEHSTFMLHGHEVDSIRYSDELYTTKKIFIPYKDTYIGVSLSLYHEGSSGSKKQFEAVFNGLVRSAIEDNLTKEEGVATRSSIVESVTTIGGYTSISTDEFNQMDVCLQRQLHNDVSTALTLELYRSDNAEVVLYATPNTEVYTASEFMKNPVCGELGAETPLAVIDGYQLWWSQLGCGFEVGEYFDNATKESEECVRISNELLEFRSQQT